MLHDLRLFARHQPNRTTVTLARSHKDRAFETRHVGTLIRIIGCYSRWLVPSAFIAPDPPCRAVKRWLSPSSTSHERNG